MSDTSRILAILWLSSLGAYGKGKTVYENANAVITAHALAERKQPKLLK